MYELSLRRIFDRADNQNRRKAKLRTALDLERVQPIRIQYPSHLDFETDSEQTRILFDLTSPLFENNDRFNPNQIKQLE